MPDARHPERTVIYYMTVSLDGYINDREGAIDWSAPDPELFAFHTEQVAKLSACLLGRRLYETMLVWETDPGMRATPEDAAFADQWSGLPKVVFSTTLDEVQGSATRLAEGTVAEELDRFSSGVVEVGGATLAAECIRQDLIDEYWVFVYPILLGGGTRFFPERDGRLDLELVETRQFERVTLLRYRRVRGGGIRHI